MKYCRFCDLNDYPGVIYDHECTGESNPGDPMISRNVLFSHWIQDVHAVIDQLTEGPIVLVGCSMGGKKVFLIFPKSYSAFLRFP